MQFLETETGIKAPETDASGGSPLRINNVLWQFEFSIDHHLLVFNENEIVLNFLFGLGRASLLFRTLRLHFIAMNLLVKTHYFLQSVPPSLYIATIAT